jgi:hypothetical protein
LFVFPFRVFVFFLLLLIPHHMVDTTKLPWAVIGKYFEGEDVPAEILIPSALYYREDALKDPALQKK